MLTFLGTNLDVAQNPQLVFSNTAVVIKSCHQCPLSFLFSSADKLLSSE